MNGRMNTKATRKQKTPLSIALGGVFFAFKG